MNTYLALKLIHVVAAIAAVGTNLTYFFWLAAVRSDPGLGARILPHIKTLDARIANPGYIVLPVTGILMVLDADHLGFTTLWIATAIGLYVALGTIAGLLFVPALRRQVELAAGEADAASYAGAARRTIVRGIVTMVPAAAILYLMVFKPTP
jgi:uncharacterized membrane protein